MLGGLQNLKGGFTDLDRTHPGLAVERHQLAVRKVQAHELVNLEDRSVDLLQVGLGQPGGRRRPIDRGFEHRAHQGPASLNWQKVLRGVCRQQGCRRPGPGQHQHKEHRPGSAVPRIGLGQ